MSGAYLKLIGRIITATGIAVVFIVAASMRGVEPGTTFATQGIDLKIDSKAYYNGALYPASTWSLKNLVPGSDHFFNFADVKPGDWGKTTISMHVKKSDAWLCLDFKNLTESDNDVNEPELHEDANGSADGELAESLEFFSWIDDGDNTFEMGERPLFGTTTEQSALDVLDDKTYSVGDIGYGSSCKINQTRYVGIFWCAGDLTVDFSTATITCDGSVLGNEAQTDSMSVDVIIRALPSREHPKFLCTGGTGGSKPPHKDYDKDKHKDYKNDKNNDSDGNRDARNIRENINRTGLRTMIRHSVSRR